MRPRSRKGGPLAGRCGSGTGKGDLGRSSRGENGSCAFAVHARCRAGGRSARTHCAKRRCGFNQRFARCEVGAGDQHTPRRLLELGAVMLYHILYEFLYPMNKYWPPLRVLNVFQYITFRTAYASITALLISLLLGPWLITRLREFQIGQHIREEGPKSHQKKAGTPTMGGLLIVVSIIVPTLLWTNLRNRFVWMLIIVSLAYAAVGFADDYIKVVRRRSLGLTARQKFGLQILISLSVATVLLYWMSISTRLYSTRLTVP